MILAHEVQNTNKKNMPGVLKKASGMSSARRRKTKIPSLFIYEHLDTKMHILNKPEDNDYFTILNHYLPIAIYYADRLEMREEGLFLRKSLSYAWKDVKDFEKSDNNRDNRVLLTKLLEPVLKYEEEEVFEDILRDISNLNYLLNHQCMNMIFGMNRSDFAKMFFECYKKKCSDYQVLCIIDERYFKVEGDGKKDLFVETDLKQTEEQPFQDSPQKNEEVGLEEFNEWKSFEYSEDETLVDSTKLILIIKRCCDCTDDEELLLDILSNLRISNKKMARLMLLSNIESRLVSIVHRKPELLDHINYKLVLEKGLFKLLIIFDPAKLIDIFNEPFFCEKKEQTVYDEICRRIKARVDVEELCNVLIHVNRTFWDLDKLNRFQKSVSSVFFEKNTRTKVDDESGFTCELTEKKMHTNSSGTSSDWLIHIQNPLLFCIILFSFFMKLKKQLDYKSKEISDLSKMLLSFCINYTQNTSEDVLIANLFEKDSRGLNYMDYIFIIGEMSLLEVEFIEGIIYQMWDLGRHTMQTVTQFMRLSFLVEEMEEFSFSVLTKKYEMPIESNDTFQLEFRFTSNSVFTRVMSEIVWPITLIVIEFIFSLRIIEIYKEDQGRGLISSNWVLDYFKENPYFGIIHLYLRTNYFIASIIKWILLKSFRRGNLYQQWFYTVSNILYITQYSLSLSTHNDIFTIIVLQTTIVMCLIFYVLYTSLALNQIGVNLRILAGMVYVVLIFSTLSCFIMILIAYPIHSVYVDFSQKDVSDESELNMFQDLYNGVLTLFEFVFGAVVFVRPYTSEDGYTYSMAFIMIMFSFFGNIMLANILVTFLAKQFYNITRRAKYYTASMQYSLIRLFDMKHLDAMFTIPYPFTVISLPLYLFMLKPGPTRSAINLFLQRFIHLVNVALPTVIVMNAHLLMLVVYRYLQILIFIILRVVLKPVYFVYWVAWVLAGPFFLLKLFVQDNLTMCQVLFNLSQEDELLSTQLSDSTRVHLVEAYSRVYEQAERLRKKQPLEEEMSIEAFLKRSGMHKVVAYYKDKYEKKHSVMEKETGGEEEGEEEREQSLAIGVMRKFDGKYSQEDEELIPIILSKFSPSGGVLSEGMQARVSLKALCEKARGNVSMYDIDRLVGFDLAELNRAYKLATNKQAREVMDHLAAMRERITGVERKVDTILGEIEKAKARERKEEEL